MSLSTQNTRQMPLVQLRLVAPFVTELEHRGMSVAEILKGFALERENLAEKSHYVTAATMYRLAERISEFSGDSCFGVHVGAQMDFDRWPPTVEAARTSSTVGEFLLRFMEAAGKQANTGAFVLHTAGKRTTFQLKRFTDTGVKPCHNDGFTIAYLLKLIRSAVGDSWDGGKVVAQVCEPGVIPPHYLGIRTASCDSMGPVLNFPSTWLLQELSGSPSVGRSALVAQKEFPATNVVESFRLAVRPHIADPDLNAEMAAAICGTRKRTLARRLQRHGTSISAEIQGLKQSRSEQELADAGKSIKAIAQRVGYTDPVVFSRAFKRWTGLTPSQFRADN